VSTYNETYYKSVNYIDYLDRYAKYLNRAAYITTMIDPGEPVLDFGCGVGFMSKAMLELGYNEIYGYDPSEWAIQYGRDIGIPNLSTTLPDLKFNTVFMFDVLEHMSLIDIYETLGIIRTKYLCIKIPVSRRDGDLYLIQSSIDDKTHLTCLSKSTWRYIFRKFHYEELFIVNGTDYYDSEGMYCAIYQSVARS
jgi:cyclopropane fatty-acyl-phospholipid synthase-like methyltransferase